MFAVQASKPPAPSATNMLYLASGVLCVDSSVKKFEKVNQSNIFLYHVIEKMIFYKFIIFWRIPKSLT